MTTHVHAYRKDTGEKVWIPERWLRHPRLGQAFSKTPRQKAADREASAKRKSTTTDKGDD